MDVLMDHLSYIYGIAIVVTIIALAISTRYSLRNLFNIRGTVDTLTLSPNEENSSRTASICPFDATGNDGDDEADEEDVPSETIKERQPVSSHCPVPLDFFEHIQGEAKRVKRSVVDKAIGSSLTEQQLLEEKEAQCRQLAEIFRLMKDQQDQLGIGSMDDMQEQMKLYAI